MVETIGRPWTDAGILAAIAVAALVLRIAMRLYSGSADYWTTGYTFYFDLARNVAAGEGLAFDIGVPTALRVPLYPLFLAMVTSGQQAFLTLVFVQAAIGAATVVCVGLLTKNLFGSNAGLTAALLAAVYPYYVIHDTAIQETSLFTFVTLLSVLLLIRTRRSMSGGVAIVSGITLGAAVLTRATIAPFAVLAPLWLGWAGVGRTETRLRASLLCAGALAVAVSPWLIRSYLLTGSPALTTELGVQLFTGNNAHTFRYYPLRSIDLSHAAALDALPEHEWAEIDALRPNEVLVDRWFLQQALVFMRENPGLTMVNGFRKIGAAFSPLPSPRRSFWPNLIYLVSYGTVMTFGLIGMACNWRAWREHGVIYILFLTFAITTAVFFGHTSHRSFLDVYWIAYSGAVVAVLMSSRNARPVAD